MFPRPIVGVTSPLHSIDTGADLTPQERRSGLAIWFKILPSGTPLLRKSSKKRIAISVITVRCNRLFTTSVSRLGLKVGKESRTEYTTRMSLCTARRKSFLLLLLVLILIVGICCLTTYNSSVDMLGPVLVMLFVLLAVCSRSRPTWAECAISPLGPYLPAAPDRAPPAQL
jgi:hypothetical protein